MTEPTSDYEGTLPQAVGTYRYIGPYFGDSELTCDPNGDRWLKQLLCPQDRQLLCTPGDFGTLEHGGSYGFNSDIGYRRLDRLPSDLVLLGECASVRMLGTIWHATGNDRWNSYTPWAHFDGVGPLSDQGSSNYGFVDGHVKSCPMEPAAGNTLNSFQNAAVEGLWRP